MGDLTQVRTVEPRARGRAGRWARVQVVLVGRSFFFAIAGLKYLFRTQMNARIELGVALAVFAMAGWLGVSRVDWAILVLAAALVLILEGINTAIEAVVDLASPRVHPLAKIAKDVAAGAVLIASSSSVVIGLLLLGPRLWAKV